MYELACSNSFILLLSLSYAIKEGMVIGQAKDVDDEEFITIPLNVHVTT